MNSFKLTFLTNFHGELTNKKIIYDGIITRVILAKNIDEAKEIGNAMLGEEVYLAEYLKGLAGVVPAGEPVGIYVFDGGNYAWQRVLEKLQLRNQDVEFLIAEVEGQTEKVGLIRLSAARLRRQRHGNLCEL